jgi:phage terminase small subunit
MTPKQEKFCQEYVVDHNATQAAIRSGYSAKTAGQQGDRLLKKVEISKHVEFLKKNISERVSITVDEVVAGLRKEAERTGKGSVHSARVAALAHLGKYLGMFTDRLEVQATSQVMIYLPDNGRGDSTLAIMDDTNVQQQQ